MSENELIEKYFHNKKTKQLFYEQISNFNYYKDNYITTNRLKKGDEVIVNKNTLIHGTRLKYDEIDIIAQKGLISSEFYSTFNKNKKKPFVVEFFYIKEDLTLKDYLSKYTGFTINFLDNHSEIIKSVICPYEKIKEVICSTEGYRDYIIYQNQEQRFLPNEFNCNSNIAFVIQFDDDNKLIKNDTFHENFDRQVLKNIYPKWFYKKYMITRKFDNYETGREKAIIYGIPESMFNGIIVSRKYEGDEKILDIIKEKFPNCYIANLDGKVIRE